MALPTKDPLEMAKHLTGRVASHAEWGTQAGSSPIDRVCLEVPVRIRGSRVTAVVLDTTVHTEAFQEDTQTLILFPQGAVIRLSANVAPGQVVVLTNQRTKQEVGCRVVNVRSFANVKGYVEIEFTERATGFWGLTFPSDPLSRSSAPVAPSPAPVYKSMDSKSADSKSADFKPAGFQSKDQPVHTAPSTAPPFHAPEGKKPVVPHAPAEDWGITFPSNAPVVASVATESKPKEQSAGMIPSAPAPPVTESKKPIAKPVSWEDNWGISFPLNIPDPLTASPTGSVAADPIDKHKPVESGPSAATASQASQPKPVDADRSADLSRHAIPPMPVEWDRSAAAGSHPSPPEPYPAIARVSDEVRSWSGDHEQTMVLADNPLPSEIVAAGTEQKDIALTVGQRRPRHVLVVACASVCILIAAAVAGEVLLQRRASTKEAPVSSGTVTAPASPATGAAVTSSSPAASELSVTSPPQLPPETASTPAAAQEQPRTSSTPADKPNAQSQWSTSASLKQAVKQLAEPEPVSRRAPIPVGKLTPRAATPEKIATLKEEPPPVVMAVPGAQAGAALTGIISGASRTAPAPAPVPISQSQPPKVSRVKAPRLISSVRPSYPMGARQMRVEGDVTIQADIDAGGNVLGMKVVSGPRVLHEAAMEALRRWKYDPATLNDQPVPSNTLVTIKFRLN